METEATKQEMLLTIKTLTNRVEELESIVAYFKRQMFGKKSEKNVPEDPDQLSLFKDDLPAVKLDVNNQETEVTVIKVQKQRKQSGKQFTQLPVIEKVYHHKTGLCPFGNPLKCIGKKMVGQKVRYLPAKLWLEKQLVENYTCDCEECFAKNGQTAFYQGELPGNLFPGSSMSPELLRNIVYQKYSLGTPLYRQLKDWQRLGWQTTEPTLSRQVIKGAQLLEPLYDLLHEKLLKAPYLQGDETVVQVLREPGKKATSESRMWVLRTNQKSDKQGIFYAYQPDCTTKSAQELYHGFKGVLQCDGYPAYSSVDCLDRVGCLAHVRRKFFEAAQFNSGAKKPLKLLDKMFYLERQWKNLSEPDRFKVRQEKLAPVFNEFWECLARLPQLPKSPLGKAIKYAYGKKTAIDKLLEYGALDLSNNTCEQAVKALIIDRKNFLFSTSVDGAKANAIWLTMTESAKANGLDPQDYLIKILTAFSQRNFTITETELRAYLPWNQKQQQPENIHN